jgi:small subunit ribosomal protein S16
MLAIRLQRTGRKHEPTFRVVLTDSQNGPKSGKYLKNLGWYDTRIKNKAEQLNIEQIKYWMSKGAKLSLTLHNYLISQKVIEGKKLNALPRKSPVKKREVKEVAKEIVKEAAEETANGENASEKIPAPAPEVKVEVEEAVADKTPPTAVEESSVPKA